MNDAELLALDPGELMDVARDCYLAEVKRRGLKRRAPVPAERLEESEPEPEADFEIEEPVAVQVFRYAGEARLARDLLQAEGIPCYVENEQMLHDPVMVESLGGIRVMVPVRHEGRARDLLAAGLPEQSLQEPWDGEVARRFVETNGIRMHIAEAGSGPLVVLLHGFPELGSSWRHQLEALAEEGYHAVAPDLRGYGQTDRPEALESYDIFQLTADIAGLVDALAGAPAVVAGHDWGALIASHCALLRPDLFRGVALLSVPFVPRRDVNQSQWEERTYPGKLFYQASLRSPLAEAYFGADVKARLLAGLWRLSGDVPREKRWKPVTEPGAPEPPATASGLPRWLEEQDLATLAAEFQRTGFTGGLNYYRNMDRNWALTPFLNGAKLLQRTLFLAGSADPVLEFLDEEYQALEANVPNLWKKVLIPGAGHWIQQERPDEVSQWLVAFLNELEAGARAQ